MLKAVTALTEIHGDKHTNTENIFTFVLSRSRLTRAENEDKIARYGAFYGDEDSSRGLLGSDVM
jgi:hypothetical protein